MKNCNGQINLTITAVLPLCMKLFWGKKPFIATSSRPYYLDCSFTDPTHLGPGTIGQPKLVNQLVHPPLFLLPGHMERHAQGSREVEVLSDGKGSHDYVILNKTERKMGGRDGGGGRGEEGRVR